MTCVALDMDETLGHFAQASQLWSASRRGDVTITSPEVVACLLEIPGLFNPDLPHILNVLNRAKRTGKLNNVVLYTNNVGDREWPEIVTAAVNIVAGRELITDVIAGYRGVGDKNEPRRTTSRKTVSDLTRCTPASRYIFVDNEIHDGMVSPKVDYVKVDPHVVTVSSKEYDDAVERTLGKGRRERESVSRFIRPERERVHIGTPFSKELAELLGVSRIAVRTRTRIGSGRKNRTRRK